MGGTHVYSCLHPGQGGMEGGALAPVNGKSLALSSSCSEWDPVNVQPLVCGGQASPQHRTGAACPC